MSSRQVEVCVFAVLGVGQSWRSRFGSHWYIHGICVFKYLEMVYEVVWKSEKGVQEKGQEDKSY